MTVYSTGKSLLDNAADATPTGTLAGHSVNSTTPGAWPYSFYKDGFLFTFYDDATPAIYDDEGDTSGHPAAGQTKVITIPYTVTDGITPSAPANFIVTITGASGGATPTAPDAFGSGDWSLTDVPSVGEDRLSINITTLPADNGDTLTALKYKVDSGSGYGAEQTLSGTGTGSRQITVLAGTTANVALWAENSIGAGPISVKSQTPTLLTPEPTADVTVANSSALDTLLGQLASSYSATVAGYGKTAADEFYIDCASGAYTNGLSSKVYANMVHVRAADRAGGCTRSNTTITNTTNFRLAYFAITGNGTSQTYTIGAGCVNVGVSHCLVYGHPTYGQKISGGTRACVEIDGSGGTNPDQCFIEYCVIERAGSNGIRVRQATNIYIGYNINDEHGDDDMQIKDVDGGTIEYNWGTVRHRAGTSAHMDGIQFTKDSATGLGVRNVTVTGNVAADWDNQTPDNQPYRQNIWGTVSHTNITARDWFVLGGNTNGVNIAGSGYDIQDCAFLRMAGGTNIHGTTNTSIQGNGTGTFDNNIERDTSGKSGSLLVTEGDYPTYFGALRTGGDTWDLLGYGGDFSDACPKAGTAAHWAFGGTKKGPWRLLKRIFNDGLHPGNDGYPTASKWNATHNKHGRIS